MKHGFIKVAATSPSLHVADCIYNAQQIINSTQTAAQLGCKVLVFPELCITGYTCGDLFLQDVLLQGALDALEEICQKTKELDTILVVGLPLRHRGKTYNCAAVLQYGKALGIVPKTNLPNYGEFYEQRHFTVPSANNIEEILLPNGQATPFGRNLLFQCKEIPAFVLALEICEDLWAPAPPSISHACAGATVVANLSASTELLGKADYRKSLVINQSSRLLCSYIYADANREESTSDIVFAGHNMIAENGALLNEVKPFAEGICISEVDVAALAYERRRVNTFPSEDKSQHATICFSIKPSKTHLTRCIESSPFIPSDRNVLMQRCESIFAIQVAGLQKRLEHTRTKKVIIGISGGLDSTLALLVAYRTLQKMNQSVQNIIAVTMPGFGTTTRTKGNAELLCQLLGVTLETIDITDTVRSHFKDIEQPHNLHDVVFENAQARMRTLVLMDLANKHNGLVIGTGDLSELALGWATYNGDHMSMYAVNISLPKTLVRHVVEYEAKYNTNIQKVLLDILDTPVSPELLPANNDAIQQVTEEIVGPYELHDFFMYYILRWGFSPSKIMRLAKVAFATIYEEAEILRWLTIFYRRFFSQQFKRNCLPDGPKIGSISLSPRGDWRMPSDANATLWLKELELLQNN